MTVIFRFSRSKLEIKVRRFFGEKLAEYISRTFSVAVAVSAITGTSGEVFFQQAQVAVVGAEVMAPLRNAVRLIDRNQGHLQGLQKILDSLQGEPFRGDIQDFDFVVFSREADIGYLRRRDEELMNSALTPQACKESTWSFINAISGETTRVMPSSISAGNW